MINKNDVEKIIEEVILKYVAEMVIEKLNDLNKTAVVIFTGASIGFTESIKNLRILRGKGWKFKVVMSKGAENAIGISLIKDMLSLKEIITEDSHEDIKKIIENNNFIIIPSLTVNTASKVVNCISDNLVTNVISNSLAKGKPIIASLNGCCPDNEERNSMGFNVSEPYKEKLRTNLVTLKSYGIKLTTSENLAEKVNKAFMQKYCGVKSNNIQIDHNQKSIKINDKLISRSCIYNNIGFPVIKINKDAIITDLAKEEAAKLNIKLLKEFR